jgi:hypothetical protein
VAVPLIPDSWGWEQPSAIADPAEDLAAAAARQALAAPGWEPIEPRLLLTLEPNRALTDSVSHVYWTRHAIHRGPPAADFEAERIEWISLRRRPALIADSRIRAACTVAALLLLYHTGPG